MARPNRAERVAREEEEEEDEGKEEEDEEKEEEQLAGQTATRHPCRTR